MKWLSACAYGSLTDEDTSSRYSSPLLRSHGMNVKTWFALLIPESGIVPPAMGVSCAPRRVLLGEGGELRTEEKGWHLDHITFSGEETARVAVMPGLLAAGAGEACGVAFLALTAKVRLGGSWNGSWASVSSPGLYKAAMGPGLPFDTASRPQPLGGILGSSWNLSLIIRS